MAVQVLNCASMSPWWPRWRLGGVCLLVDTDHGPVLVDSGLGLHDHEAPSRMVKFYRMDFGIRYAPEETAVRQVARLGIRPENIQHIVQTHLHFDHAGGLADFPWATVHAHRKEVEALYHPRKPIERFAYDRADFIHEPQWVLYDRAQDKWFDFDAIPLPFTPRMYLIPLFGHTTGHCGVVIETQAGWIFQAADSLPLSAEFDITPGWVNRMVLGNHVQRIKTFAAAHPEVRLFAGHAWLAAFEKESKIS